RLARAETLRTRRIRVVVAGVLSAGQQRDLGGRCGTGAVGNALAAGVRGAWARQDIRRTAGIRGDVPGAHGSLDDFSGGGNALRVAARQTDAARKAAVVAAVAGRHSG